MPTLPSWISTKIKRSIINQKYENISPWQEMPYVEYEPVFTGCNYKPHWVQVEPCSANQWFLPCVLDLTLCIILQLSALPQVLDLFLVCQFCVLYQVFRLFITCWFHHFTRCWMVQMLVYRCLNWCIQSQSSPIGILRVSESARPVTRITAWWNFC